MSNWCSINSIVCEYATNNCVCSLTACNNIGLVGNTYNYSKKEEMIDIRPTENCFYPPRVYSQQYVDELKAKYGWHTGTPTEEGWYLFKLKDKTEPCWYRTEYLTIDRINKLSEWYRFDECKWQKIKETD